MEDFKPKQHNIEKNKNLISAIEWNESEPQKFVILASRDGNNFALASYPADKTKFHMDIVMKFINEHPDQKGILFNEGGGWIKKENSKIIVYGTSTQVGKFNSEKTITALKLQYPDQEIVEAFED